MQHADSPRIPVTIRQPTRDEIPKLAALGAELFIETFGHLYTADDLREFLDRVHSIEGVTKDWDSGMRYWIAEHDLDWLGYCKGGKFGLPINPGTRRALELKQLYVRKPFHGRGISHQLIQSFLEFAKSTQTQDVYISCWSENHRGLAFYAKYGFEVVGSYTFWVGEQGDDERILRLSLDA